MITGRDRKVLFALPKRRWWTGLPPRIQIRENAPLELPHILILIDDPEKTVIEPVSLAVSSDEPIYDFELMENGGNIKAVPCFQKSSRKKLRKAPLLSFSAGSF